MSPVGATRAGGPAALASLAILALSCAAPAAAPRAAAGPRAPSSARSTPPPAPVTRSAAPARPAEPGRRPHPLATPRPAASRSAAWEGQRDAWARLWNRAASLAAKGAHLPGPKLRKHARRLGLWPLPSVDPSRASPAEKQVLSATGPAAAREALGPAGRGVWVEIAGPRSGTSGAQAAAGHPAARVCALAAARCGLVCTIAPPLPSAPRRSTRGPDTAQIRRLQRLRADHDLVLLEDPTATDVGVFVPSPHATDLAAWSGRAPRPSVPTADTLRPRVLAAVSGLRPAASPVPQPLFRLTLGLRLPGAAGPQTPLPERDLAEALCRLGDELPDAIERAWEGNDVVREARAQALARWLGLAFVERPVATGRAPYEHRYIRVHYRDRVFTFRRRPGDGAYLIRPLMVVIHDTGSTSLSSALYTLRAQRIGPASALHHAGALAVGVPYVVGRDGTIYRIFRDDARFGRHTIGLNHSAIGIENVGNRHHPLTPAQIAANQRLVEYASLRYPLGWLVGHREVYQMAHTPYYLEAVPGYCSSKNDPTWGALRALRGRLAHLGLKGPPSTRPLLRNCEEMFQFFKKQRRAHAAP